MPWPKLNSGANRQIGSTQLELMHRAMTTPNKQIMVASKDNALHCAMKRMVQRGLFRRIKFGTARLGFITVYELTCSGERKYREVRRPSS